MKTNVAVKKVPVYNHEGGKGVKTVAGMELIRTVATCMLFENTFYESGNDIAKRIEELCTKVSLNNLCALAVLARNELKLRHVPLFLLVQAFKKQGGSDLKLDAMLKVVTRPDQMGELVSLYWKDGKKPLPSQMKKGLAKVFTTYNAFQLAKWNRDAAIKIRDIMFLTHPKPENKAQESIWKKLVDGTLEAPDTWEVALSAGKDKKETWTRLLLEKKLGSIALIMNLRNMVSAGVDTSLISNALLEQAPKSKLLPFRYITAVKHAPSLANDISEAMLASLANVGTLPGRTWLVVDVSGSMDYPLSVKGTTNRIEAACAMAILAREACEDCRVFTFSNEVREVCNYRGLPLAKEIVESQSHGGTYLRKALAKITKDSAYDRIIVITDEQSADGVERLEKGKLGYIINVAPYKVGLSTEGGWQRINGWSERVFDWICFEELGRLLAKELESED